MENKLLHHVSLVNINRKTWHDSKIMHMAIQYHKQQLHIHQKTLQCFNTYYFDLVLRISLHNNITCYIQQMRFTFLSFQIPCLSLFKCKPHLYIEVKNDILISLCVIKLRNVSWHCSFRLICPTIQCSKCQPPWLSPHFDKDFVICIISTQG